jgi:hypothetical protein
MTRRFFRGRWILAAALVVLGLGIAVLAGSFYFSGTAHEVPPPIIAPAAVGDITHSVHQFCGACHAYPPPDSFPRSAWKKEVEQGYLFFAHPEPMLAIEAPPIDQVVQYYEERAPLELPLPRMERATSPLPIQLKRMEVPVLPRARDPAISNVNLVHLFDERCLDVLACDMRNGLALALRPYVQERKTPPAPAADPPSQEALASAWQVLGKVANPAHAEVVDLDGDGIKDVLVANLGNFSPTDRRTGSVVWLRGQPNGSFVPITLLDGVGRVADVQAADFRGTGTATAGSMSSIPTATPWTRPIFSSPTTASSGWKTRVASRSCIIQSPRCTAFIGPWQPIFRAREAKMFLSSVFFHSRAFPNARNSIWMPSSTWNRPRPATSFAIRWKR